MKYLDKNFIVELFKNHDINIVEKQSRSKNYAKN